MNRQQRRLQMKAFRKSGLSKEQAKATVNAYYMGEAFKAGQKAKFNWELIIRNPQFNQQKDEFREWVTSHKDEVLTVEETRYNGTEVTFVEDESQEKFWHKTMTLIPVASATIKLNDGTVKSVNLDGINDVNDPKIMEEVNKVMEE